MPVIGTAEVLIRAALDKFKSDLFGGKQELKLFGNSAETETRRVETSFLGATRSVVALTGGVVALSAAGYGLKSLADDTIEVASSFEQMGVKLNALTKGNGAETLERINAWALDMPVNTRKAVDTFAMMQAMGLQPTIDKMQTLVDVSSVFGEDAMPRVARALGQMTTLGKLSAEELNQMAEAGVNARKYLTAAFGMTVEELQKSKVSIDQITDAIWNGLNADYAGASQDAQKSWQGLSAAFTSNIEEIQKTVMDAGVFDEIKNQIADVNKETRAWLEANRELIAVRVPEYIDGIKESVSGVIDVYNSLPAEFVSVAGYGIIGRIFFGGRGPAALLAYFASVDMAMRQFGFGSERLAADYFGIAENAQAIYEVMAGMRDANTGNIIAPPGETQKTVDNIASLKAEISELETNITNIEKVGLFRTWGEWTGTLDGDRERLERLRKELEHQEWVLHRMTDGAEDFWLMQAEHYGKIGAYKDFWQSQAEDVKAYAEALNSALNKSNALVDNVIKEGTIAAAVAEAKEIEDIWLKKDQEKTAVAERGAVARYEIAEFYAAKEAKLNAELAEQRFVDRKDFWQMQAEERLDVADRAAQAETAIEQERDEEIERAHRVMWKNIQSHFGDTITNMFSGGVVSANDFFDSLEEMGKRTLGEMAAKEFTINIQADFKKIGKTIAEYINENLDIDISGGGAMSYAGAGFTSYQTLSSLRTNKYGETKDNVITGAVGGGLAGYQLGGGYGAVAGALIGGVMGYHITTDEVAPWFADYVDRIIDLTATIQNNNKLLSAELNATNSYSVSIATSIETLNDAILKARPSDMLPAADSSLSGIQQRSKDIDWYVKNVVYNIFGGWTSKHSDAMDLYGEAGDEAVKQLRNEIKLVFKDIDSQLETMGAEVGIGLPDTNGLDWSGKKITFDDLFEIDVSTDAGMNEFAAAMAIFNSPGNVTKIPDKKVPVTEYEKDIAEIQEAYEDLLGGLMDASEALEGYGKDYIPDRIDKLEKIYSAQIDAVDKEFADKIVAATENVFTSLDSIIDPASDLASQLEQIEIQVSTATETLEGFGRAEKEIIEIQKKGLETLDAARDQYWQNTQLSVSGMLNPSSYVTQFRTTKEAFAEYKKSLEETGEPLSRLITLQNQEAAALATLYTNFSNVSLGIEIGEIQKSMQAVNSEFTGIIGYQISILAGAAEITKYQDLWVQATLQAMKSPFISLQSQISEWRTGNSRTGWGRPEWISEQNSLMAQYNALDPSTESFYDDALQILTDLWEVERSLLEVAQTNLASTENSIASIDNAIFSLTQGSLAAVQSIEGYDQEYERLFNLAKSDKTEAALNDFLSYATGDYLEAMKAFNFDYQTLTSTIAADLGELKGSYETERDLLQQIVQNTGYTNTIVSTESTLASLLKSMTDEITTSVGDEINNNTNQQMQTALSTGGSYTGTWDQFGNSTIGYNAAMLGGFGSGEQLLNSLGLSAANNWTNSINIGTGALFVQQNPFNANDIYSQYVDQGESFAKRSFTAEGYWNGTLSDLDRANVRVGNNETIDDHLKALAIMTGIGYDSISADYNYYLSGIIHDSARTMDYVERTKTYTGINGQNYGFSIGGEPGGATGYIFDVKLFENGGVGYPGSLNIFGEKYPEIALPMHDTPPHDAFIKSVGIDRLIEVMSSKLDAIGNVAGGRGVIELHLHLNDREISYSVDRFAAQNPDEMPHIANSRIDY